MRARRLAVLASAFAAVATSAASAQTTTATARDACPDVAAPAEGDPVGAAEQALCWYERDRNQAPDCVATREGSSVCIAHAARWCEDANLELDPQVANACFLARVRERQLDEAARIAPLLAAAWREVEPCRAAVTEGVTVEVTTSPEGGAIFSDGHRVGETRALIRLAAPFWRQGVSASFGDVRSDVTPEQLVRSFDVRACTMRPLRIERPAGAPTSITVVPPSPATGRPPPPRPPRRRPQTPPSGGISVPGLLVGGAGIALAAAGSVLLVVAEGTASDIRDRPDGTEWSGALQSDYDSI
ncbi:MAG: hypothetical protein IT379_38995, partial [Deltaproteobacteria bacterium]|nr:hypothetical protein [Deltaproteobacteria bacterium]